MKVMVVGYTRYNREGKCQYMEEMTVRYNRKGSHQSTKLMLVGYTRYSLEGKGEGSRRR